jgi:hypothetical protein
MTEEEKNDGIKLMSEDTNNRKMFTIHLIESESGYVHAITDYTGEGEIVLRLGTEILNTLALIQPFTEGRLSVAHPVRSDAQH